VFIVIAVARTQTQEQIAFTVKLGTDGHYMENPVVFSSVVTNIGSAYSTTTGNFTCSSHRGVYVFSTTLVAFNDQNVNGVIVKNGVAQITVVNQRPTTISSNEYPSASGQVVLSLVVGDRVWVRNNYNLYAESLFAGFLLYST
jgi:hypothetical protein